MRGTEISTLMGRLKRRARRLTGDEHVADDLAQDVMVRLIQADARGFDIRNRSAYAMRILSNLARSAHRNRTELVELDESMLPSAPVATRRLICADVVEAIDRLPPAQAELLWLVASGELSPIALAQRTGLPKGTVMSRLARARARLRRDLDVPQTGSVTTDLAGGEF